ncbi:hypothetical protein LCGC14_0164040 [marine sediment metagenome]|uniref:Uncharacterized protein n=1 Tax=marine sediment metagenome TaxID=412755 RepID=A0A0F9UUM7_9ZZZZ
MTLDLEKIKEALASRPTNCPYCKISVPGSVQMACTNLEDDCEFQIWCSGCWAHGPTCSTLQSALDGWNRVADASDDKALDEYEIANLMGLLMRSAEHDNGDWFCQVMYKLIAECRVQGLKMLDNNFGDRINVETLALMSSTQWTLRPGQQMLSGGCQDG